MNSCRYEHDRPVQSLQYPKILYILQHRKSSNFQQTKSIYNRLRDDFTFLYILTRPKILLLYNVDISMFIFDSDLFQKRDLQLTRCDLRYILQSL